jgi:hypothetical protein
VLPKVAIGWRLAKKAAGYRTLMNVISADAVNLVKGSHGRVTDDPKQGPLVIAQSDFLGAGALPATDVRSLIMRHVFDD